MNQGFTQELFPILDQLLAAFPAPFHIMHERGIIDTAQQLHRVLRQACPQFRNFFAVKANSNPEVLRLLYEQGMGFDCSSIVELRLARATGAKPEDIFFTSNDTSQEEFEEAMSAGGCILNLDDKGLIPKVPEPFPKSICFRWNAGKLRVLDSVIGNPETCKYGVPHEQIVDAYRLAQERGAERFGLHAMLVSNERNWECHAQTVGMLLETAALLETELGIRVEFINMGGGLGIPYRPEDEPVALEQLAEAISKAMAAFEAEHKWRPLLRSENGRYVTGPHGVFIARCINEKHGYREFRGVNVSAMAAVMRPTMYHPKGGYHHITVFEPPLDEPVICSVVGPACEDSDRFGWDRLLSLHEGQHVFVHDIGAHATEMGSNYNNRPKPPMLMLRQNGQIDLIEPGQTVEELVAKRFRYLEQPWSFKPAGQ
jgi:diaminopimelate decarboxylase